ncbi:MAG: HNH endonuclease [Verrucomicrobiia bacterium]
MFPLFRSAIYVNASNKHLRDASRGSEPSHPITEKKRWTSGKKLLDEARSRGEELPLIFAVFAELTFWAVAREITLYESSTEYQFADLQPFPEKRYRRSNLVVRSTGAPLPDTFIKSYALVQTPPFLSEENSIEKGALQIPQPTPQATDLADAPPDRVQTTTYRILRDTVLARRIKIIHEFRCQVCGHTIELPDGSRYAEAHHIQPLGEPHNGRDVIGNILCLCPNHHAELDYRVSSITLAKLRCSEAHAIDARYVDYHNRLIQENSRVL